MNLDDLIPAPNAKKVAQIAGKTFGYTLDLDKLNHDKAVKLRESFAGKLAHIEKKLGAKIGNNRSYLQNKLFLEAIDKYIAEGHGMHGKVCKDCGCEFDNPKPGCDCSHDGHNANGSNWISALELNEDKLNEILKRGTNVKVPHKGETVSGKVVRYDEGDKHGSPFYVVDVGEYASVRVAAHRVKVVESVVTEGTLENSELVLAAKDMVDKIQAMVEDLGEMQNEQLGPLTDAIRDEMGTDVADQFKVAMEQVVVGALENMRATRDAADQASRILQGEAPPAMMGPEEEPEMEPTTDMDMEQPAEEDFGAADAAQAGDEELGRERRG